MLSLAVMIYLVARSVPRVGELITPSDKKSYLENWLKKVPWHKIDSLINSVGGKFLRRLKIIILKFDNLVSKYLNKFKAAENGNKEVLNPGIFENKIQEDNQNKTDDQIKL